jgi:hypothetical protein
VQKETDNYDDMRLWRQVIFFHGVRNRLDSPMKGHNDLGDVSFSRRGQEH